MNNNSSSFNEDKILGTALSNTLRESERENCLSLEEIAEFLDGNLLGSERERLMKHLSACNKCYEIYITSLRVKNTRVRRRPIIYNPWAMAASFLIVVFAVLLFYKIGVKNKVPQDFNQSQKSNKEFQYSVQEDRLKTFKDEESKKVTPEPSIKVLKDKDVKMAPKELAGKGYIPPDKRQRMAKKQKPGISEKKEGEVEMEEREIDNIERSKVKGGTKSEKNGVEVIKTLSTKRYLQDSSVARVERKAQKTSISKESKAGVHLTESAGEKLGKEQKKRDNLWKGELDIKESGVEDRAKLMSSTGFHIYCNFRDIGLDKVSAKRYPEHRSTTPLLKKLPFVFKRISPATPSVLVEESFQGTVLAEVEIDTKGNVLRACVIKGHTLLNELALEAILKWKFKPIKINGVLTPVKFFISISFKDRGWKY